MEHSGYCDHCGESPEDDFDYGEKCDCANLCEYCRRAEKRGVPCPIALKARKEKVEIIIESQKAFAKILGEHIEASAMMNDEYVRKFGSVSDIGAKSEERAAALRSLAQWIEGYPVEELIRTILNEPNFSIDKFRET